MRNPKKSLITFGLIIITLLIAIGVFLDQKDWLHPENVQQFLELARGTVWALPTVCLVYVLGGLIMFPVTLLSLVTTAVFGALWGPIYAMSGALLSATVLFWIGHIAGLKSLRKFLGERVRSLVKKLENKGIVGIVVIRLTPIAPYSLVNLAAGLVSIRFSDYIIGTFLGLLPGLIAKGILGDSLMQIFLNPTSKSFAYLILGIAIWMILVIASQKLVNYLSKKKNS